MGHTGVSVEVDLDPFPHPGWGRLWGKGWAHPHPGSDRFQGVCHINTSLSSARLRRTSRCCVLDLLLPQAFRLLLYLDYLCISNSTPIPKMQLIIFLFPPQPSLPYAPKINIFLQASFSRINNSINCPLIPARKLWFTLDLLHYFSPYTKSITESYPFLFEMPWCTESVSVMPPN